MEAISLTRGSGPMRLSEKAFARFVASGLAPAAVARQGGEALWNREEIKSWAGERLQALLEGEARALLRAQERSHIHREIPDLTCVHLDPSIGTHRAVLAAEERLVQLLRELQVTRDRQRRLLAGMNEHHDNAGERPRIWLQALRRRLPTTPERRAKIRAEITRLDFLEAQAHTDLTTCRAWLCDMLGWAEAEANRRRHQVLEHAQLDAEERKRAIAVDTVKAYPSARSFADEDSSRVAQAWKDSLQLGGADFGYRWRHDEADDVYADPRRSGAWRVSWFEHNGELYAVDRRHDTVLLIGVVPTSSLAAMIEWLRPIEARQDERNSLALIVEAYGAQQKAGFPALEHGG